MFKTIFRFLFWSVAVDRKTAITSNSEQVVASYFECNKWTKLFSEKKNEKRTLKEKKKRFQISSNKDSSIRPYWQTRHTFSLPIFS